MSCDIALIGLAVMGQNLVLNMNDNGYKVVAYNRTASVTQEFLAGPAKGTDIVGAESLEEMVLKLSVPRKIMIMVKAGDPVDLVIESLLPMLEKGDVIIDGGNANYPDSQRRAIDLKEKGFRFVGAGVSGGEEGARFGPSIMPGGNPEAWPLVKDIFQAISAKTESGAPCCEWVGENGAGHFVKMVHNGIEYGDMQLICEAYQFMKDQLHMSNEEMQAVFKEWDQGDLGSYLIEITADILGFKEDGEFVVDKILDKAGQKGTGKWTAINSLELGMPVTLIGEAVFARCLSALKSERVAASKVLNAPAAQDLSSQKEVLVEALGQALLASKIVSYAQGFMLMRAASENFGWDLQYGSIAHLWRGGCIIRSVFLDDIKAAYDKNPALANLLLDDYFLDKIGVSQAGWRKVLAKTIETGVPMPTMTSALAFYDGYRTETLPANLLQAQRDYFGAHTYERVDKPEGERFHSNWTGTGGDVSSTSYDV
ncbi:decarboxylating NADP(+)-dependent phosphogluconate dehydrogenase [Leucothrix arctica]|uniref:6-phosphogluconate dehydrogenase, decarboxylating n=1 Tax=Leucothrix arctica TaxID=1481894 RepID=A0A317C941_9GAMM|nr:decarboxylating NADP(+)-dependent phosphogluconate dehydrogenase [Leucothrix arctica]PWQ94857.1 phosphogluconate dehydrogenase (NADP(+)-dependent, decarboxylating) [Leucothrix arctica]